MEENYPRKKLPDELNMKIVLGGTCLIELWAELFSQKLPMNYGQILS